MTFLTPRQYLSWTQFDLFRRSPERYKAIYFYNEKQRINRAIAYGKQLADGLENDEATGDLMLDLMAAKLPKFEIMDKPITAILKDGKKEIPLLAKPDTMKKNLSAFKEYKTGQGNWSIKKANELGQMLFYATVFFLLTNKIPDMELIHLPTEKINKEDPNSKLIPTGEMFRYKVDVSTGQVLVMLVEIKKVWYGIIKMAEEELL